VDSEVLLVVEETEEAEEEALEVVRVSLFYHSLEVQTPL